MDAIREKMATDLPEGMATEKPTGANNFIANRQRPAGGGAGMSEGGRDWGGGENSEMRERMNELMRQYSLGDVKVLIPVGIPIYTRVGEASLVNITVGSNITVWLNQDVDDRKIAEFVNLR